MRPESLPLLVAELRENRQANVPGGRLVNEAVAILRLFRSRPPSVTASVGLVGLYAAVCALTIVGALTMLHLSVGDVWNLRTKTQARREQAAHARAMRRQAAEERKEAAAANEPAKTDEDLIDDRKAGEEKRKNLGD